PCIDCRACKSSFVCSLKEVMQEIYRFIGECDNVVIASPLYYSEVTGKLLDVASRFQIYYSARAFRHETPDIRAKRGGVILVGGGDGKPDKAYSTSVTLLHHINTAEIFPLVCSHSTDTLPAAEDTEALNGVRRLADFLNRKI
ncbi:MAG: flavodoxin family protein, partial [Ruminiclostridium sp.]|nr:flavodoxin family protein [Ruminiclostridium sp.]